MPKTIKDVLGALFIGLLCSLAVFSLGAVFSGDRPQQQSRPCAQNAHEEDKRFSGESFWQRATTDPVAFFTLWLTVFTAVLAVSTIGLWIVTWRASGAQARDMEKSIAAANRSAEIAERALVDLNRAFVFVKSIDLERGPDDGVTLSVKWENSSATQTRHLWGYLNSGAVTIEDFPKLDFPDIGDKIFRTALVGPKGVLPMKPFTIPPTIINEMTAERSRIFIWGWVEYDDIFPNTPRHRTEFCNELVATKISDGSFDLMTVNHTERNGAEDECGLRYDNAQKRRPIYAWANQTLGPATQVATGTVSGAPGEPPET